MDVLHVLCVGILNVLKIMSNKVQIFYIYAENCKDCQAAKIAINTAIQEAGISCEMRMFNCEERVAVNIAIKNNITDIPACIIENGVAVFQGKNFYKDDIIKAIKKASSK